MNNFLIYALKSVLSLGLFALVYRISLGNERNFTIRRIYLLISVSLAMLMPFITFSLPFGGYRLPAVVLDEVIVYSNGIRLIREASSFPFAEAVKAIYFLIAGFLIFRIFLNVIIIFLKARQHDAQSREKVKLYFLPDKNISYSFFRNIFIGHTAGKEEMERILAHEKVHSLQLHSIDVMYIELLSGVFWFNPLIWWFRKEIKNVHEYLADEGALETGFSKKEYQITILEHLIGSASLTITNSFNYSLIKNRIAMMNKEKNGRKNIWKVYLLLPVSIIIAFTFACAEKNNVGDALATPANTQLNIAYYQAEQMPVFPGGMEALSQFIAENVTYPAEALSQKVQGKVMVQFVVDQTGKVVTNSGEFKVFDENKKESSVKSEVVVVGYKPAEGSAVGNTENAVELLKKEAVRVISMLPAFEKPGTVKGEPVAVVFTIPINFRLQ